MKDLRAAVKFTHIALEKTGFSKFNTKVLCLQFLATVSPSWDTLLPAVSEPGAPMPALPPGATALPLPVPADLVTPAPAAPRLRIDVRSMSQAERRSLRKELADVDSGDLN
jgi:hypothetical protein